MDEDKPPQTEHVITGNSCHVDAQGLLTESARVGNIVFRKGTRASSVVAAAQANYRNWTRNDNEVQRKAQEAQAVDGMRALRRELTALEKEAQGEQFPEKYAKFVDPRLPTIWPALNVGARLIIIRSIRLNEDQTNG